MGSEIMGIVADLSLAAFARARRWRVAKRLRLFFPPLWQVSPLSPFFFLLAVFSKLLLPNHGDKGQLAFVRCKQQQQWMDLVSTLAEGIF